MITHEEARKYAHNIITEDTTMKHHRSARELYGYANQQEKQEQRLKKVEELLTLYKSVHDAYRYPTWKVDGGDSLIEILNKISQLEKELSL